MRNCMRLAFVEIIEKLTLSTLCYKNNINTSEESRDQERNENFIVESLN